MSRLRTTDPYGVCKCGRRVVWARLPSGKLAPLDAAVAVYRYVINEGDRHATAVRVEGGAVLHFATCKYAREFSHGQESRNGDEQRANPR